MRRTTEIRRNSNVELMKIIALGLIVISHSLPRYGDYTLPSYVDINMATQNMAEFTISFLSNLGSVGNCMFVVCSSWFLCDDTKLKIGKIGNIAINTWVINVIYLLVFIALGYNLSGSEVIEQIFPITYNTNWFVGCYILFYLLHPAVNLILRTLTNKQHFSLIYICVLLYSILQIPFTQAYYCNEIVSFYFVYIIVAYIKKYIQLASLSKKRCILLATFSCIFYFVGAVLLNYAGLHIDYFSHRLYAWRQMNNPFIIAFSVCTLLVFLKLSIQLIFSTYK